MLTGNHMTVERTGGKIVGNHNTVTGNDNEIVGNFNIVRGNGNRITGNSNKGHGARNVFTGNRNIATGQDITMTGKQNQNRGTRTAPVRAPPPPRAQGLTLGDLLFFSQAFAMDEELPPVQRKRARTTIEHPSNVDADVEAKEGEKTCSMCMTNAPNCIIVPCGHRVSCIGCSGRLVESHRDKTTELPCPTCRTAVEKIIQVYE